MAIRRDTVVLRSVFVPDPIRSEGGSNCVPYPPSICTVIAGCALTTMQRSATFADLPVELAERIILLIAHRWTVEDKPSLANLACASRAIHRLVQPILFQSVVLTERNVSNIRPVAHLFRSTRTLTVQDSGRRNSALLDFYGCSTSFPKIDLYVGPLIELHALMRYINPERIVMGTVLELDHLFANSRYGLYKFSRLTHLRVASRLIKRVRRTWLRVTHLWLDLDLDYEHNVEVLHARVAKTLALLLGPEGLRKLQRMCVQISDSARATALRKDLESYAPLRGETRLWLAVPDNEHPGLVDPFEDEYWLVGTQVYCGG